MKAAESRRSEALMEDKRGLILDGNLIMGHVDAVQELIMVLSPLLLLPDEYMNPIIQNVKV